MEGMGKLWELLIDRPAFPGSMGHYDECVEEKTSKRGLLRILPVNWPETNAV